MLSEMLPAYLALARAVEARNPYTFEHSVRVADLAVRFGRHLGLAETVLRALQVGGLLHDLGKIGVPDAVLLKRGPLDRAERALLERHPAIGCAIVEPLGLPEEVLAVVRHHHERWDGCGYPQGLAGGAIPLVGRVVALADAWDAMRSERPYRSRLGEQRARREIRDQAGCQFDPELAAGFEEFIRNIKGKEDRQALQDTQNMVTIIPCLGSCSFQLEQLSRLAICQKK